MTALGEFAFLAARLWPFYVASAAFAALVSLVSGDGLESAARAAVMLGTFAVMFGPLGWVAYNEWGSGLRRQLLLFLIACLWLAALCAPAIWILSWADP